MTDIRFYVIKTAINFFYFLKVFLFHNHFPIILNINLCEILILLCALDMRHVCDCVKYKNNNS